MTETVIRRKHGDDLVIALVGNPNVGKSSLFNALTGLNQHTGNWPGKTVSVAQGRYTYKGRDYILVDLPGTYSMLSQSEEERIAVEFILSGQADCTLILGDATCLERNLHLALQIMELTDRAMLCVNLQDEAQRLGIQVDLQELERQLGIPVIGTSAQSGQGIERLKETLRNLAEGFSVCHPKRVLHSTEKMLSDLSQRESDRISAAFGTKAAEIAAVTVSGNSNVKSYRADHIILGKWTGRGVLLLLLFLIFWLTIKGANYPSALLQGFFDWLGDRLRTWLPWLPGLFLDGIYATAARVVSVMLPPMAIFFPLFTLLEDLGYLPRAAFLMDNVFEACGSCGKQVLTMSMGFGCNAVGVTGCRIISSPRERLIAILTNALVPCNGRFPAMIALIGLFFTDNAFLGALILLGFILLSVGMTLLASRFLSGSVLRGTPSHFVLELPPYRKPRLGKILVRSLLDRTAFVLGRAVLVAAPAGALIWLMERWTVNSVPFLTWFSQILEPFGVFLGMNGVILAAFFLSIPANELLLPMILLILGSSATQAPLEILLANGWTWKTALCTMVFFLFHWPCSTTCLTIKRETDSWLWTLTSVLLPTGMGMLLCSLLHTILR